MVYTVLWKVQSFDPQKAPHYDSAQVVKLILAPRDLLLKYLLLRVLDDNSSNATSTYWQ